MLVQAAMLKLKSKLKAAMAVLAATLALVLAVTVVPVMPELVAAPLEVLLEAVVPQAILAH